MATVLERIVPATLALATLVVVSTALASVSPSPGVGTAVRICAGI
jgi:hypothetical protein